MVKWVGYPDPTPEALSKIQQQAAGSHPDIIRQIAECKAAYLAGRPDNTIEETPAVPEPTRIQPARDRQQARRFMFTLDALCDGPRDKILTMCGLADTRAWARARAFSYKQFLPDVPMVCC